MSSAAVRRAAAEPKEFGGTLGVLAIYFLLPAVVYGLFFFCNKEQCGLPFLSDVR